MSESAEWQLPWWLRFLDRTNLTVTALTAAFVAFTRSAGVAYFIGGAVACSMSVKVVKKFVRQPRPVIQSSSHRRPKKSYGMPSTHSATISYYATYIPLACIYSPIHHSLPQHTITRVLPPLIVVPLASLIAASRVWLGHHNWAQVLAGCLYGVTFAFICFGVWNSGAHEYGSILEQTLDSYIGWR
ncbi:hypothetical protein K435DRAFT_674621 [Dendrothele bispora CBS 962.96]|uniref:Phosphatidic acid phosphatase type 2/haloperoxidase domain-containing protein n=1 Tax=Dendrothele bispora (strain CBS 962.96) TaxID=1314807 RepID=A0A4S8LKM2_DENBC|nr:hypothetical protein K435DRAFT_677736 [Dendrothele bispora CBS 962.96]THU91172.1 hypothetical protein K435DRAFT_674621 [Dendrothele bispora CBS 962.96]